MATQIQTKVSTSLFIVANIVICASQSCQFPRYLQSKENEFWHVILPDLYHTQLYVEGGTIIARSQYSHEYELYRKTCEKDLGNDTFLVSHNDPLQQGMYQCIRFHVRSISVIQMSSSNSSVFRRAYMCEDKNLIPSPWPLLSVRHINNHSIVCPLTGGFDMTIHNPDGSMKCNHRLLPLRLESECESGEGMSFKFRYADCVNSDWDVNYNEQKVSCIASWSREVTTQWKTTKYTFIALRQTATYNTKFWCMRIEESSSTNMFQAHLFMDFVCDEGEVITHTKNYVILDLSRRIFDSPCADESEDCNVHRAEICETEEKANCPKTCGICNVDTVINVCNFNEGVQGKWLLTSEKERRNITIDRSTMTVEKYGQFACQKFPSATFPEREILLQQFENGCHPRYLCVDLATIPRSNSVLKYRLSNPTPWPLFHKDYLKQYVCSNSRFTGVDRLNEWSSMILVKPKKLHYVRCKIPFYQSGVLGLSDSRGCRACLYHNHLHKSRSIEVTYLNCTDDGYPIKHEYQCISRLKHTFSALITKSRRDPNKFLCWVFLEDGRVFAVLPGDCSEDVIRNVKFRDIKPIYDWAVSEKPEYCGTSGYTRTRTTKWPVTKLTKGETYTVENSHGNPTQTPNILTDPRSEKNIGNKNTPNNSEVQLLSKYFLFGILLSTLYSHMF